MTSPSMESPGRERAIETLMDMDPQGAFYRASRILDEAVPQALSSRPNLVTRAAVVEQAYALRAAEIDTSAKYYEVFQKDDEPVGSEGETFSSAQQERILRHHDKLLAATTATSHPVAASLDAVLQNLYGDDSLTDWRQLLGLTNDELEASKKIGPTVEHCLKQACRDPSVSKVLVATLSLLESIVSDEQHLERTTSGSLKVENSEASSLDDEKTALQVGAILSLLKGGSALDDEFLHYLGTAAAVYEERLELQQSRSGEVEGIVLDRILSTVSEASSVENAPNQTQLTSTAEDDGEEGSEGTPPLLPPPQDDGSSSSSSDEDDDDEEDEDDEDHDDDDSEGLAEEEEMLHEALAMSLEDQMGEGSEDEDEDDEDDDIHDSEGEEGELAGVGEETTETATEATQDGDGTPNHESPQPDNSTEVPGTPSSMPPLEGTSPTSTSSDASTPLKSEGHPAPAGETKIDEQPLPSLPTPPSSHPYASLLDAGSDFDLDRSDYDTGEKFVAYMDPSEFSKFGAVPSSHVLLHLLQTSLRMIQKSGHVTAATTESPSSVPGGMGYALFAPPAPGYASGAVSPESDSDRATSLQLLVACIVDLAENRTRALESLQIALLSEESQAPVEDEAVLTVEDDPALALAMNYMEDSTSSTASFESLEAKGMRRKAAAAAHEAAVRLRTLQKQTETWKKRLKFLSESLMVALKCLRAFLESALHEWLDQEPAKKGSSMIAFHTLLPVATRSKLSSALSSVMNVSIVESLSAVFSGDLPDEIGEVLLTLPLYKEGLRAWTECIPMLHPSREARIELLRSLLNECQPETDTDKAASLDSLDKCPSSELQMMKHRLQMLLRRFCVSDILDNLVDRPIMYNPEDSAAETTTSSYDSEQGKKQESLRGSELTNLLQSAAKSCEGPEKHDLDRLHLATRHRCNVQILMWDGLYSSVPEDAAEFVAPSHPAAVAGSEAVRVNPDPSNSFVFDASKCSESIAILPSGTDSASSGNGFSALQRASKVWGTVLSSTFFSPKTGVHRWALRLDKCEKGHVFVGVATTRAALRTYVGGDKYGWGVIGTQALWHDRKKIRGDYGATFRTGSTIIVTLDTDAGTLSFSTWKENSNSSSFSLDHLVQAGGSPRRQTQGGGTLEDWGVAFEGLPLDSRLYPAVGLYQRDDQVTLLSVESGRSTRRVGIGDGEILSGGRCYYPGTAPSSRSNTLPLKVQSRIAQIRQHNSVLTWDGIKQVIEALDSFSSQSKPAAAEQFVQSLAAALCMVPPCIPVLSQRFALYVLPHLTRCIEKLKEKSKDHGRLFANGLRGGQWIIRATGSSASADSTDCEEYVVTFSKIKDSDDTHIGFEGSGIGTTGRSKNGLVKITGTVQGSALCFVEEWKDGSEEGASTARTDTSSSCVVNARLSLDGKKFEGLYRNVQYGTIGHISGAMSCKASPPDAENERRSVEDLLPTSIGLLCLAHGHLTCILAEDVAADHALLAETDLIETPHVTDKASLDRFLTSALLSHGLQDPIDGGLNLALHSLRQLHSPPPQWESLCGDNAPYALVEEVLHQQTGQVELMSFSELLDSVESLDEKFSRSSGKGPLSALCQTEYAKSRQKIVAAMLYHSRMDRVFLTFYASEMKHDRTDDFVSLWRNASKILDDTLRESLASSDPTEKSRREQAIEVCERCNRTSSFLLRIQHHRERHLPLSYLTNLFSSFYLLVKKESDLNYIEDEMKKATSRALLRLVSLSHTSSILSVATSRPLRNPLVVESLAVAIPRVLGRRWANRAFVAGEKSVHPVDNAVEGTDDLGGYYLSQLSGSGTLAAVAIRRLVHGIFGFLGGVFEQYTEIADTDSSLSFTSLTISILAAFTVSLRAIDIAPMAKHSGIVDIIPSILSRNRGCIRTERTSANANGVEVIHGIMKRDILRSLLRSAVAAVHVFSFHCCLSSCVESEQSAEINEALHSILTLIFEEIEMTMSFAELIVREQLGDYTKEQTQEEGAKFIDIGALSASAQCLSNEQIIQKPRMNSGVSYLAENGCNLSSVSVYPSSPRSESRDKSSGSRSDAMLGLLGLSCQHYISQWLHVLCCMVKSSTAMPMIGNSCRRLDIILRGAGLFIRRNSEGKIDGCTVRDSDVLLPARYRARLLRLLGEVLLGIEADTKLARGLFMLAGASISASRSPFDEGKTVSREAVTLLRRLYCPSHEAWRLAIHNVIGNEMQVDEEQTSDPQKGIFIFFSGSISAIDRGSYVLLKPAAAASVSLEEQSIAGNKFHAGLGAGGSSPRAGMNPHHVVGTGTAGIIAGLCRNEASAGIVSSVDAKSGMCEIILIERHRNESTEEGGPRQGSIGTRAPQGIDRGLNNARFALTVRAVRTPLSDVAHCEEVPLFLDTTIEPSSLISAQIIEELAHIRARFSEKVHLNVQAKGVSSGDIDVKKVLSRDGDEDRSRPIKLNSSIEPDRLHTLLLMMRSAGVVLSDERVLSLFVQNEKSFETLYRLLEHASYDAANTTKKLPDITDAVTTDCLSELPSYEARYSHVVAMLKEINFRKMSLDTVSSQVWEEVILLQNRTEKSEQAETDDGRSQSKLGSTQPGFSGDFQISRAEGNLGGEGSIPRGSMNAVSQSSGGTNGSDEEEESESAATAAAHLREAAIAQMAELGLPRSWSELALRRTGGTNIEAAVHFCLERGGDMERLLAEERERERMMQRQISGSPSVRRRSSQGDDAGATHLLQQLLEMGFPSRWCAEALSATGNNVDEALTWILTNGERLSAEDEGVEAEDAEEDADDAEEYSEDEEEDRSSEVDPNQVDLDEEEHPSTENVVDRFASEEAGDACGHEKSGKSEQTEEALEGWSGSVTPLRFVSGRSIINPQTLSISGLPTGGFSSVGTKGVMLSSGKWYYEAVLETAGCLQIGWADGSFSGHCNADRGDGCGDGPSSWAFDGWRRYRWHSSATEWGCRWKEGDVVGCLVDMDDRIVSFTLNGRGEEIGMGVAFSGDGFRPCGGVYACVSFNRREKLRLILGGNGSESFRYPPPSGVRGVGEAVLDSVKEHSKLLEKESILDHDLSIGPDTPPKEEKRFLCDFSDGEHGHELFAWQHRYYGSDASVHLGSGRSSRSSGGSTKSYGSGEDSIDISAIKCVSSLVRKEWTKRKGNDESPGGALTASLLVERIREGYNRVAERLEVELINQSMALSILYARKVVLHLIVTMGKKFELSSFVGDHSTCDLAELEVARRLWNVLEKCVSLRSAGWVGEAGAMALAAEALGLGISSNDNYIRPNSPDRPSSRVSESSLLDLDDEASVPSGGVSQFLSAALDVRLATSTLKDTRDTGRSLAACAEAAIGGGGGGGPLVFLQQGLQSAARRSVSFRKLLIGVVRRSVRLLAVVDYSASDSASETLEDDDLQGTLSSYSRSSRLRESDSGDTESSLQSDARLVSFLTGLLMSEPVKDGCSDHSEVLRSLFEAWSVGLLSASMPWRMISALHASGILALCPEALERSLTEFPTLSRFYARLPSTVVRRAWAERAAAPVCSRFIQAIIDLLASVRRALHVTGFRMPFIKTWESIRVDAATPLPLEVSTLTDDANKSRDGACEASWEWDEGWVVNDSSWEVWTGSVHCMPVEWTPPARSAVRTLMDGGDGPPMLREGCIVMRGLDWDESRTEDGKNTYDDEKAKREKEKRAIQQQEADSQASQEASREAREGESREIGRSDVQQQETPGAGPSPEQDASPVDKEKEIAATGKKKKKKRKKPPSPKLPVGTVVSIEPWNGVPALGRKVKWKLTGVEGVYRFGGDGGRFDLCHVEVNDKCTRVKARHPLPESAEQCAARHGFGTGRKYNVVLRLRRQGREAEDDGVQSVHQGILEWPDFGAAIRVECIKHSDGAVTLTEKELLYGSKDSGWEARFGQPSYVPGTVLVLSPTTSLHCQAELDARSAFQSLYEELLGSSSFAVKALRNRADGGKLSVTSEMRLFRGRPVPTAVKAWASTIQTSPLPPIQFDGDCHASSIALSRDGRTATCVSHDGRGSAFASVGFTKGVHYWEAKIEQADIGSVFIGVAEKPNGPAGSSGMASSESQPRLNRWHGWGFVNFRATFTSGAERVYGAHCHAGDTIGVLLDCDAGRVSYFFDGLKYGEHILNDLGCAFENISPFGFNADGCGSGGAGQGAPSGVEGGRGTRYPAQGSVKPRALWPVIGLRYPGDRVTLSSKWMTNHGVDGHATVKNVLAVNEVLCSYMEGSKGTAEVQGPINSLPNWFVEEAFDEYKRWHSAGWCRSETRGSGPYRLASFGLDADLDTSSIACASASAALGLKQALLPGDRVVIRRSAGRLLELAEEAVVLGACQGRLFYRIVSQKSEGGSLREGGGRAWFWDESEVVGNSLQLVGEPKGLGVTLPLLDRFRCLAPGGLKVVYEGGAVVRSDLEIFDGSVNIGSLPVNTIIPFEDVIERRVNSCGVIRYLIRFEERQGWISSNIRGGKEEAIIAPITSDDSSKDIQRFGTPLESALAWKSEYKKALDRKLDTGEAPKATTSDLTVHDLEEFRSLLSQGRVSGLTELDSDRLMVSVVNGIADFAKCGDALECSFEDIAASLTFAVTSRSGKRMECVGGSPGANQAALAALVRVNASLPSVRAMLARIAMLRAFNRRARLSLPWMSTRPTQEGTAIFGGLCGHGSSVERAGRSRQSNSVDRWVQPPSIAFRLRSCRGLLFCSAKRTLFDSITDATTTPTPLSHDEYELPREIRTVRVNRLKARRAMMGDDNRAKRKHSVFSQLHSETRAWGGASLRRGFVAKGHGGQKRAFKVKLIGEGVNDYSGPYREVFTDAMEELMELDKSGHSALGVLDPTPNHAAEIGEHRELFMFSTGERDLESICANDELFVSDEERRIRLSFASLTMPRDEASRESEDSLVFLGRLAGTACRHGIPVDLQLPLTTTWKAIAEDPTSDLERLEELDLLESRRFEETGEKSLLLCWQQRMLNSFVDGLSNVLPTEVMTLLSGAELRDIFCGNPDVDVDLLRRVTEYEGYDESDPVVQYFWDVLREMSNLDRKKFLQFVWARSRLPVKESDFEAPFKLQRDSSSTARGEDAALPSASTCFFSLSLPEYSSKDILKEKLQFAIDNVCTMESDYVTNDSEVGEGWRGLS